MDIYLRHAECPDEVREWAVGHFLIPTRGFPGSAKKRRICYCSKCGSPTPVADGAAATQDGMTTVVCKGCGSRVVVDNELENRRVLRWNELVNVFRVIDGIQFIFFYRFRATLRRGRPYEIGFESHSAIAFVDDIWFCIRKPWTGSGKQGNEFRIFLENRPMYTNTIAAKRWSSAETFPGLELLPVLRYRGFDPEKKSIIWKQFNNYRDFTFVIRPDMICLELAAKRNDFDFIKTLIATRKKRPVEEFLKYNQAYKIANRHGYISEDWKLWLDMVDLLVKAGKDIHNPRFVCPRDIREGHDLAMNLEFEAERRKKRKEEREYFENGPFDIHWHARFNPDFNQDTLLRFVEEYGYPESETDRKNRECSGIPERRFLLLNIGVFYDIHLDTAITFIREESLDELLVEDENGVEHRVLAEPYRGLDIRLSPDNVVLNPEVLFDRSAWQNRPQRVTPPSDSDFTLLKSRFIGLEFRDEELVLMTLGSPAEYCQEAHVMHNCIASLKYYLKKDTLIMSARVDGKPVADVEISLEDFSMLQCYGPCNTPTPYRERIEKLYRANIDKIKERMASGRGSSSEKSQTTD